MRFVCATSTARGPSLNGGAGAGGLMWYNAVMSSDGAREHVERLRQWRNRPAPEVAVGPIVEGLEKQLAKGHKQFGKVVELWLELVPEELASKTRLASLSRGVLTVEVPDSVAMYELDRLLRSGVERELRERCKAPVRSVRVKVAAQRDG